MAEPHSAMVRVDKAKFIEGKGYFVLMDRVRADSPTGKSKVCVEFEKTSGGKKIYAEVNSDDLMYLSEASLEQMSEADISAIKKAIKQKSYIAKCGDDYDESTYEGFNLIEDGPHDPKLFYIQATCSHGGAGYDGPSLIFEVATKNKSLSVNLITAMTLNGSLAYDPKSKIFLVEDLDGNKAAGCYKRNRRSVSTSGLVDASPKMKICYGP